MFPMNYGKSCSYVVVFTVISSYYLNPLLGHMIINPPASTTQDKRTEAKAPVLLINLNYSAPLVCLARLPMFSKLLPEKFINEGLPLTPAYNFDSTNASCDSFESKT